ncbi:hypothetical protein [Streptomyces sp. NPDC003832]
MTRPPLRWQPDDQSAAIIAAYARHREPWRSVLRRALIHLAQADGLLDARGHVITQPGHRRRQP